MKAAATPKNVDASPGSTSKRAGGIPPVSEVSIRHGGVTSVGTGVGEQNQLLRTIVGQGSKQDGVRHAEHGDVGSTRRKSASAASGGDAGDRCVLTVFPKPRRGPGRDSEARPGQRGGRELPHFQPAPTVGGGAFLPSDEALALEPIERRIEGAARHSPARALLDLTAHLEREALGNALEPHGKDANRLDGPMSS